MAQAKFLQDTNGNKIYPYSHADATFTADGEMVGTVLESKVDKIDGKGLSTNDYTTAEKESLTNVVEDTANLTQLVADELDNLIPFPYDETTKTEAGIDYVVNSDGTISANGTSTGNAFFNLQKRTDTSTPFFLPKGTYTLSGCPKGGGSTTYRMSIGKTNVDNGSYEDFGADVGNGITFTLTEDSETTQIQIMVKTTVENLTFKPMLVKGDTAPTEYKPYNLSRQSLRDDIDELNATVENKVNTADLDNVAFSGSYSDLSNTPTIPTKTSQLTNDSGFVTTDTKVTQTVKSDDALYPLLLAPSGQTATTTTTACFDSGVTLNTSTNVINAHISGNAGTATKLANPHTIDGVSFDGSAGITHYGTCSTAAATVEKVVACTGFTLVTGATIKVRFTVTNTANNPTLNVNSTGAIAIKYRNGAISAGYLAVNRTYEFVYDGTYYQVVGDLDANTFDRIRHNGAIKCSTTAIVANNLIVGSNGTYQHLKLGKAFDVTYPILFATSAIAASATGTNNYKVIPMTITTTQSITLTAYKPVYIKGKLSGTTFTPVSTTPLTQTVPTSADGYQYILVGLAYSTTAMYLLAENPIYEYSNGVFGLYGTGSGSGINQTISTTEPTTQSTGDHWLLEF